MARSVPFAALAGVAVFASGAWAAPTGARLDADAFRTAFGPMIRFAETGLNPTENSKVVRSIRISRPRQVSVAIPSRRVTLGGLVFFVGPRTCPTCPDRRSVRLGRLGSVGGGSYLVGRGHGARVVLSTRYRSRFLSVSLPPHARNVRLTLTRRGSRLVRFPTCRTVEFRARFSTIRGHRVDGDVITGARLRRAGLC